MDAEQQNTLAQLANVIEKAYLSRRTIFWNSFLSGLFSGLGATIGVAIILTLLGLLIRKFGGLPVIGNWLLELNRVLPKR